MTRREKAAEAIETKQAEAVAAHMKSISEQHDETMRRRAELATVEHRLAAKKKELADLEATKTSEYENRSRELKEKEDLLASEELALQKKKSTIEGAAQIMAHKREEVERLEREKREEIARKEREMKERFEKLHSQEEEIARKEEDVNFQAARLDKNIRKLVKGGKSESNIDLYEPAKPPPAPEKKVLVAPPMLPKPVMDDIDDGSSKKKVKKKQLRAEAKEFLAEVYE